MRIRLLCGIAVWALVLTAASVHGQDTASLTGTVRDSSGAVVAGAQVVVTNTEHGINRSTVANSDGEYLSLIHIWLSAPLRVCTHSLIALHLWRERWA